MLLIVIGALAATSSMTLVLTAMCRAGVHLDETVEALADDPRSPDESARAGVAWEEIAMRTDRPPRPRSTIALRRRHLAAVLPADARR